MLAPFFGSVSGGGCPRSFRVCCSPLPAILRLEVPSVLAHAFGSRLGNTGVGAILVAASGQGFVVAFAVQTQELDGFLFPTQACKEAKLAGRTGALASELGVKTLVLLAGDATEVGWFVVERVPVDVVDVVARGDAPEVVLVHGDVERDRRFLGNRMGPVVLPQVPPLSLGVSVVPQSVEEDGLPGLLDPLPGISGTRESGVIQEHVLHDMIVSSTSKSFKGTHPRFSVQTLWVGVPVSPKRVMTSLVPVHQARSTRRHP